MIKTVHEFLISTVQAIYLNFHPALCKEYKLKQLAFLQCKLTFTLCSYWVQGERSWNTDIYLRKSWSDSWQGQNISSPKYLKMALGPTQAPIWLQ